MKNVVMIPHPWYTFESYFGMENVNSAYTVYSEGSAIQREKYNQLIKHGINPVAFSKEVDFDTVVFIDELPVKLMGNLLDKRWIYFAAETPLGIHLNYPKWFPLILMFVDQIMTTARGNFFNERIHLVRSAVIIKPELEMSEIKTFSERKFACMIARHAWESLDSHYHKRHIIANYFNDNKLGKQFDLYGIEWDESKYAEIYRGIAREKKKIYGDHKFAFALENYPSVFSADKLIDAILGGIVPIGTYSEEIPKDIYIDPEDFKDIDELYHYLLNITENDWIGYIERGQDFIRSDAGKKYDVSEFARRHEEILGSLGSWKKKTRITIAMLRIFLSVVKFSAYMSRNDRSIIKLSKIVFRKIRLLGAKRGAN